MNLSNGRFLALIICLSSMISAVLGSLVTLSLSETLHPAGNLVFNLLKKPDDGPCRHGFAGVYLPEKSFYVCSGDKWVMRTLEGPRGEPGKDGETGPSGPRGPEGPRGKDNRLLEGDTKISAPRNNSGINRNSRQGEEVGFIPEVRLMPARRIEPLTGAFLTVEGVGEMNGKPSPDEDDIANIKDE